MAHVTSADGTRIAYDKSGAGPALILVDGALCSRNFGPMRGLAELLAPSYTVYAYDRRGRGESGDTVPYSVEREVEDIAALIDTAGGSARVFGSSSGGALALAATHMLGPKIARLAVWEAPYNDDPAARQRLTEYDRNLRRALAENRRGDAAELFMSLVGTPPDQIAGMRQSPIWPGFEAVAPTLAYDSEIMGDGAVPLAEVSEIATPTLLMNGDAGFAFMGESADKLAKVMPRSQRRVLPGQRHDAAADALAPPLLEFFGA